MSPTLLPEDAEYLVCAMTRECGKHEVSYAARVGIAAVILNRVEDDRYPDTASAVIASWEAFAPVDGLSSMSPKYEKEYRLCEDAYLSAAGGADPTCGALNFEFLDTDVINASPYYDVIIDNVSFYK